MASTFTALVFRGRRGFLLHVGDTRLYRLRENSLEVLTIDHTFRLPGYRNVLTRAIGSDANVKIDYSELSLSDVIAIFSAQMGFTPAWTMIGSACSSNSSYHRKRRRVNLSTRPLQSAPETMRRRSSSMF